MKRQFSAASFRECFPIFEGENAHLVYLDNAAMLQMPNAVVQAVAEYNLTERANINRGIYQLGEISGVRYEQARKTVSEFIRAQQEEVFFTSGTTAGISQMAYTLVNSYCRQGDEVVITSMEHHSNYLVWVELCKMKNLTLRIVQADENGDLNIEAFFKSINEKTKIVSFTHMSNVTGIINPAFELIAYIRKNSNSIIIMDGAQGVVHIQIDVKALDCDVYCFSGHKLGAPTGIGAVYVKENLINRLAPIFPGGGTVAEVTKKRICYYGDYRKFEPGTPNISGAVGIGAVIDFLNSWDRDMISHYEHELLNDLKSGLRKLNSVYLIEPAGKSEGIASFVVENMHPLDVSKILDAHEIAVRSGHMCAQPYLESMGKDCVSRVSIAPYNTKEDVQRFLDVMEIINGFCG